MRTRRSQRRNDNAWCRSRCTDERPRLLTCYKAVSRASAAVDLNDIAGLVSLLIFKAEYLRGAIPGMLPVQDIAVCEYTTKSDYLEG